MNIKVREVEVRSTTGGRAQIHLQPVEKTTVEYIAHGRVQAWGKHEEDGAAGRKYFEITTVHYSPPSLCFLGWRRGGGGARNEGMKISFEKRGWRARYFKFLSLLFTIQLHF